MTVILETKNLSKSFGGLVVTKDLSFSLEKGEALGIIGPNGAGKTTLFNLLTGTIRHTSGSIFFENKEISQSPASTRCKTGISRSFQIPQPFVGLSIFENVYVSACHGAKLSAAEANKLCVEILIQTGLMEKANVLAGSLTLLERKRLELARALCSKPKLILLDEIAGGLTDQECKELIKTIKTVRDNGISIIWIEHIVHALMAVVDRIMVIDFGQKIADGNPELVMKSPEVQKIYMGIDVDE